MKSIKRMLLFATIIVSKLIPSFGQNDVTLYSSSNHASCTIVVLDNKPEPYINFLKTHIPSSVFINDIISCPVNEFKPENYTKLILSYWFNRSADGRMDDSIIIERAQLNANTQDRLLSDASTIKASFIDEKGYELLQNNYIITFRPRIHYEGRKTIIGCTGSIYKVGITSEIIDDVFENAWVFADDDITIRERKNRYYSDEITVPVVSEEEYKRISSGLYRGSSFENEMKKNVDEMFESLTELISSEAFASSKSAADQESLYAIEKNRHELISMSASGSRKTDEAREAIYNFYKNPGEYPIISVAPITAQFEQIDAPKRQKLYMAYIREEDKEGNVHPKYIGLARLIYLNKDSISGVYNSRFYQLSGKTVKAGMTLKPYKGLDHYGINVAYGTHGLTIGSNVLLYQHLTGLSHCILSDLSVRWATMGNADNSMSNLFTYDSIDLGYGLGIHPVRFLELMPFAKIGGIMLYPGSVIRDSITVSENNNSSDKASSNIVCNGLALFANYGIRVGFRVGRQLWYYFEGGFDKVITGNADFNKYNASLSEQNTGFDSGVFLKIGFRISVF